MKLIEVITASSYFLPVSWFLSLTGLVWQVYYISNTYFDYETVTKVLIIRPKILRPPAVAVCFKRYYIRDITSKLFSGLSEEQAMIYVRRMNYTAKQIFDNVPSSEEFPGTLEMHSSTNYGIDYYQQNLSQIQIRRFMKQNFICYAIRLANDIQFDAKLLTNSFSEPKFYTLSLDFHKHFVSDYIFFFTKPHERSFYGKSDTFAELSLDVQTNAKEFVGKGYITLSYHYYRSIKLPYPYKTECIHYSTLGFESNLHCHESCLVNRTIEKLGKIPFTCLIDEPIDKPLITTVDNANATFMAQLKKIEMYCDFKCRRVDCIKNEYVPIVLSSSNSSVVMIELYASNSPDVITTFTPLMSVIDFITYVLSCVSFWLGFSPLGSMYTIKEKNRSKRNSRARAPQTRHDEINVNNGRMIPLNNGQHNWLDKRLADMAVDNQMLWNQIAIINRTRLFERTGKKN